MARRRRRYHGMVSLPLGELIPSMNSSVRPLDVVIGGAIGFLGVNVIDALLSKFVGKAYTDIKGSLNKVFPLAVSALAGGAIYAVGKQGKFLKEGQAAGFFWGSMVYGVAATAQNLLRGMPIPGTDSAFADVVSLPLGDANYAGLLVDNPRPMNGQMGGLLVDNPTPQRANLSALGQLSLGDDEYDGMDALAAMG